MARHAGSGVDKALGAECHVTRRYGARGVSEDQQDAAIDALRREHLRLISLTPVRTSLEAIFCGEDESSGVPPRGVQR